MICVLKQALSTLLVNVHFSTNNKMIEKKQYCKTSTKYPNILLHNDVTSAVLL